jgi:large subunit ribosomal protein L15
MRPEERDMIKRLPKLRGHGVNRARTVNSDKERPQAVSLARLDAVFAAGETVSPRTLLSRKVVTRHNGRAPQVKILATGTLSKKLTIEKCLVSEGAKAAIVAAGGVVSAQ